MSVLELTNEITNGKSSDIVNNPVGSTCPDVPVHLLRYTEEEALRAHSLLLEQKDQVAAIWRARSIADAAMLSTWPRWAEHHYYWLKKQGPWRGFANYRFDKLIGDVLA
jgi:hypothetical protein